MMNKKRIVLGSLTTLALITVPVAALTFFDFGEVEKEKVIDLNEKYSFSGNVYRKNTHEFSPEFIKSLEVFRENKIWALQHGAGSKGFFDFSPAIVTYNFSSLGIDYFPSDIFKYMDFGGENAKIDIFLNHNKLSKFDFSSIPSTVQKVILADNAFSGKLNMDFINKIHRIKINLDDNKISSLDYDGIKKYTSTAIWSSKISSINIVSDSKNPLIWAKKMVSNPSYNRFNLSLKNNNLNETEFEKNIKIINV